MVKRLFVIQFCCLLALQVAKAEEPILKPMEIQHLIACSVAAKELGTANWNALARASTEALMKHFDGSPQSAPGTAYILTYPQPFAESLVLFDDDKLRAGFVYASTHNWLKQSWKQLAESYIDPTNHTKTSYCDHDGTSAEECRAIYDRFYAEWQAGVDARRQTVEKVYDGCGRYTEPLANSSESDLLPTDQSEKEAQQ